MRHAYRLRFSKGVVVFTIIFIVMSVFCVSAELVAIISIDRMITSVDGQGSLLNIIVFAFFLGTVALELIFAALTAALLKKALAFKKYLDGKPAEADSKA
jgi:hypothetical protein